MQLVSKLWEASRAYSRNLTYQTDGRDILIVGDWEEYQKARDYSKDIQTDRICMQGKTHT